MEFWLKLEAKGKLILITVWMTCLASGLSELHQTKSKHQDLKPENVLLCLLGDQNDASYFGFRIIKKIQICQYA
jgi:serine/threonine protein kinase